jgi:hypothetical protein
LWMLIASVSSVTVDLFLSISPSKACPRGFKSDGFLCIQCTTLMEPYAVMYIGLVFFCTLLLQYLWIHNTIEARKAKWEMMC